MVGSIENEKLFFQVRFVDATISWHSPRWTFRTDLHKGTLKSVFRKTQFAFFVQLFADFPSSFYVHVFVYMIFLFRCPFCIWMFVDSSIWICIVHTRFTRYYIVCHLNRESWAQNSDKNHHKRLPNSVVIFHFIYLRVCYIRAAYHSLRKDGVFLAWCRSMV